MRAPWLPATLVALACAGGSPPDGDAPRDPTVVAVADTDQADPRSARTMGSAEAPVTVYEMSDFQCPFCRRHALETLPLIEREYVETGKIRYVFLNFPITEIHPNAVPTAELALCAARDGKFWPMHHLLFETQRAWARLEEPGEFLLGLADSVGLDRTRTVACLADPRVREAIAFEAQGSARTGANATPAFYIEGGLLLGARPIEVWRGILDSIVAVREGGD